MQHYVIFLQGFNYEIRYKKSKDNANVDALSRLPLKIQEPIPLEESDVFQLPLMLLQGLRDGRTTDHNIRVGIDQHEFSSQNNREVVKFLLLLNIETVSCIIIYIPQTLE